jgi:hypothetical protein
MSNASTSSSPTGLLEIDDRPLRIELTFDQERQFPNTSHAFLGRIVIAHPFALQCLGVGSAGAWEEARSRCRAAESGKSDGFRERSAVLSINACATPTPVLSGEAQVVHFGRTKVHAYAACRVVEVERVLARRFCSIKGSNTSPQLMHLRTVPPVE